MRPIMWMLFLSPILTACEINGPENNFCQVAKPIYFDPMDKTVDATTRSILELDAEGQKRCGWHP